MATDDALDIASALSDSEHRLPILECLRDGPVRVTDLGSSLDVPQPTIKHNLTRLEEQGLVRTTGSKYAITTFGSHVCELTTEYLRRITVTRTLTPFLRDVDDSTTGFDLLHFEDADVTAVDSTNPHAPVERLTELAAGKEYLRAVTPILPRQLHEVFHEGIVDGRTQLDLIVTADLFEMMRSRFGEAYEDAVASGRLIVGIYPDAVPFGLFLFEDAVALLGHGDENIPRCLVETDSADARRWADDLFRRFETDAESFVFGDDEEFTA